MRTRRIRLSILMSLLVAVVACGPEGCCTPPIEPGSGIVVVNGDVRACDLLLRSLGDEVPRVEFDAAVTGRFVPKGPMIGLSFIAQSDGSLEGLELGRLVFAGAEQSAELVSAACFDAAGVVVDGDPVRLTQ